MYLKCHPRFKDGKEHRYWSIAEKRRCADGRVVDRHVLYLGEINDSQHASWLRVIEAFDVAQQQQTRLALFPADRPIPDHARDCGVQVRLAEFALRRPRQWGACWVASRLWAQLQLEEFWREKLPASREGTRWSHVLQVARPSVRVKLLPQDGELYVLVDSGARVAKEWAMRRRKLKTLWTRLRQLQRQRPSYERLLLELGAAKKTAGRVWSLVSVTLPEPPAQGERCRRVSVAFALRRDKLRAVRRREGRYLLRTNLTETDPAKLWECYLVLVEMEAAFKNLKGDLAIRPIFHQKGARIEAHLRVFSGLLPVRHVEPEADQQLILAQLARSVNPQRRTIYVIFNN